MLGSPRTMQLYDRRCDEFSLDEVERIVIRSSEVEPSPSPARAGYNTRL
jgi:hypothetical protein